MQPASAPPPPPSVQHRPRTSPKRTLLVLLLLGLAFGAGYIPQKLRADRLNETLRKKDVDLALANAHRNLGIAALEAQRNNFTNAAAAAARFFDECAVLASHPAFAKQPRTRVALSSYAGSRDQIMVQLASADPAVAQRLSSLYFTMEGVLTRRE